MTAPREPALAEVAEYLDGLLRTDEIRDYPGAVNGVQVEHVGPVRRVAVAVDASVRTIDGALADGANLLVVHHGLFWGGLQPLRGRTYRRLKRLLDHDVAVYSVHLPLDVHPTVGNNVLLARALDLEPAGGFARYADLEVGVRGETDVPTAALVERVRAFAEREGGTVTVVGCTPERQTRRWGVCTGAGASSDTLREASSLGIDTLIVGEGPHHTAVDADEMGIVVVYAGHYATETLGVRALGRELAQVFGLPWSFVPAPTGL